MFNSQTFATALVRLASGVRSLPVDALPPPPFVLYANHSSHLDFVVIWAALPPDLRPRVRPVAGRDYWERGALRRRIAGGVFNAVLIERQKVTVATNPLQPMLAALDAGDSLIVFPEGTRSLDGAVQAFKAGLFHLAQNRPHVPLVPVWLDNLNRILPKAEYLAVPLIASVTVGPPITLAAGEPKPDFLARARTALLNLSAT